MKHRKTSVGIPYRIELLVRPGEWLTDIQRERFTAKIRDTAATCFESVPDYQIMRGTREELSDKVVALAIRKDGVIAGFCSTILLPVKGVGEVMHLGLTCVRPEDRASGLTHLLTRKAVGGYLFRYRPLGRLWVSNCAAVLSSLGNVALHFDNVFPSPLMAARPTRTHARIAKAIDEYYRDKIYIHVDSTFDPEHFVFRGSVKDTVFQKEAEDVRYQHRKPGLNRFYRGIMNFGDGDEVLQVGSASMLTAVRHGLKRKKRLKELRLAEPEGVPGVS